MPPLLQSSQAVLYVSSSHIFYVLHCHCLIPNKSSPSILASPSSSLVPLHPPLSPPPLFLPPLRLYSSCVSYVTQGMIQLLPVLLHGCCFSAIIHLSAKQLAATQRSILVLYSACSRFTCIHAVHVACSHTEHKYTSWHDAHVCWLYSISK